MRTQRLTEVIIKAIGLLLCIAGFVVYYTLSDNAVVTVSELNILVIANIIAAICLVSNSLLGDGIKSRFTYFSFSIAFITLILGRYIVNVGNEEFWGKHIFNTISRISYLNEARALTIILLAQLVIMFSYSFRYRLSFGSVFHYRQRLNENALRYWSKLSMYIGAVIAFAMLGAKIIYVLRYGYLSLYLVQGNVLFLNSFLDIFDKLYFFGFYGFLATFPSKKELRSPIILYIIYSFLSIMTGIRGIIVLNFLFILWYLAKRDEHFKEEKDIITKNRMILISLIGVIAVTMLYDYGFARVGANSQESTFLGKILAFIGAQGGSGRLVALGLENRDAILSYISPLRILFAPAINFLMNNSLVRSFTGGHIGQGYSALESNPDFGAVITFVTNKTAYLAGGGLGSSFIAELAVSFGIIGVLIGCIFIGRLIRYIDSNSLDSWGKNVFMLNLFSLVTYLPRQPMFQMIPGSVSVLLYIILMMILCRRKKK